MTTEILISLIEWAPTALIAGLIVLVAIDLFGSKQPSLSLVRTDDEVQGQSDELDKH